MECNNWWCRSWWWIKCKLYFYVYNLSVDPETLAPGEHLLQLTVADSHTDEEIGEYDVDFPMLSKNTIKYNTNDKDWIKIEPEHLNY